MKQYLYIIKNNRKQRKDVQEYIDILEKYFKKLQDGTHVLCIPDSFFKISSKKINSIIDIIDEDFEEHEQWKIGEKKKYQDFPRFSRLSKNAKKCMIQEIYMLFKYQENNIEKYLMEIKI